MATPEPQRTARRETEPQETSHQTTTSQGTPPQVQFSLRTLFWLLLACSWWFGMSQWGGLANVSVAALLGVLTGTYLGKSIGLLSYGPFQGTRSRSASRVGAVAGFLIYCAATGLISEEGPLWVILIGSTLLSLFIYWLASFITLLRRDRFVEQQWGD